MSLLLRSLAFIPLCVLSGTSQASLISIDFSIGLGVAEGAPINSVRIEAIGYALPTTGIRDSTIGRHLNPEGFTAFVADFEITPLTADGGEDRPLSFQAGQFWANYRKTVPINAVDIFATPSAQRLDSKSIAAFSGISKLKTGDNSVAASGFSSAFDTLVFKVPLPETAWLLLLSLLGFMALQRKPRR